MKICFVSYVSHYVYCMLCFFIIGSIADSGISESLAQEEAENLSKC